MAPEDREREVIFVGKIATSIPQLDSCCYKYNLRIGSFICLWIHLALELAMVAEFYLDKETQDEYFFVDIILDIISITADGVALYGVFREKHLLLVPFLLSDVIQTTAIVVLELLAEFSWINIIADLLGLGFCMYVWLLVFSYYRALEKAVRSSSEVQA